jgi:hypothetical protein
LYAFDILREPGLHKYRAKVIGDLAKAAALAPHADAYALVLCTRLGEIAPQLRRWVVKYSSGIIGAAKSHGNAGQEAARQSLGDQLSQLGPSDRSEMPNGSVWGLDVIVDAWLVGPINRPRLEQAPLSAGPCRGSAPVGPVGLQSLTSAQSAMAVINERLLASAAGGP